jgi:carboxymethylenebutenolidase
LHIGLAETDDSMPLEMVDRLTAALDKAGVDYQAEAYPGTRHGWAVADTPVYQREGAEHHWDRLLALFRATLQAG